MAVRLDSNMKEQGTAVMNRYGYTPSSVMRELFSYAVKDDSLPFDTQKKPDEDEIKRRIATFDSCHTKRPSGLADEEIREAGLQERYGPRP